MLYPKILNLKESDKILKILLIISGVISSILIFLNILLTPEINWAWIAIVGIIYIWITTLYAIRKNVNIGGHVLLQTVAISILVIAIDILTKYKGWSLTIAIPIVLLVSNTTMLTLTIVKRNKFFKYILYEILIFIFSMIPIILAVFKYTNYAVLTIIATSISLFTMTFTAIFYMKDIIEELKRRLHM